MHDARQSEETIAYFLFPRHALKGAEKPETAYMKLYLKSTTKVSRLVVDYTWISLLAEIGGYTGILLGISVMNLTGLLDKLFNGR